MAAIPRGGAMPGMPGGFGSYSPVSADPVARRRYFTKHVGFAQGGNVNDPMDYVPDDQQAPPFPPPQQKPYDPYNQIGREEPQVSPWMAAATGYAAGGAVRQNAAGGGSPTENAALDATAELARRTANPPANPPPLELQAPPQVTAQPPPPLPGFQPNGAPNYDQYNRLRGTFVNPPLPSSVPGYSQQTTTYNPRGFAQGGPVQPDIEGYMRGAGAMQPQHLDEHIRQTAARYPGADANDIHMKAVTDPARAGDHALAGAVLAGLRQRHNSLNAHAQGAAAHGDLSTAAALADRAHEHVPDGRRVKHFVHGGAVTIDVKPGRTHRLTGQQFHDHLAGNSTDFDHLMAKGIDHHLGVMGGGNSIAPAPTGYAEGGEVEGSEVNEYGTPVGSYEGGGGDNPDAMAAAEVNAAMGKPTKKQKAQAQSMILSSGMAEGGEVKEAQDRSEGWGDLYERVPELKNRSLAPDPQVQKEGLERMMRKPDISDDDLKAATSMYPPGRRFQEGGPVGYDTGGPVSDDDEAKRRQQDEAAVVKDVLERTQQDHGLISPAGGHTALERGIGLPPSWGQQPPTRAEAEEQSAAPTTAAQTQDQPASPGASDWEQRKEGLKESMKSGAESLVAGARKLFPQRDVAEPTGRRGGSTAAPLREQPAAPEAPVAADTSGVTADEAQRTAGPRTAGPRTAEPQRQPDKPTITPDEWQAYLKREGLPETPPPETTGAGGGTPQTGYFKPTDDPNDPWSRPANVLGQAETAPVDRRITARSLPPIQGQSAQPQQRSPLELRVTGPERTFYDVNGNRVAGEGDTGFQMAPSSYQPGHFNTRANPMPITPTPERTYPTRYGEMTIPAENSRPADPTYVGGTYTPQRTGGYVDRGPWTPERMAEERGTNIYGGRTYTGPQGEERSGPNTAVTYVRNSNGDMVPALPSGRPSSDPQPGQTYDRNGRPIPPTAAQLQDTARREAQTENRRSTDAIYTSQGYPGPYGSSPRPEAVAAREAADRRSQQPAPTAQTAPQPQRPAPVNPAYSQEPFAGGVQEGAQPVPTTSVADQAAAQRADPRQRQIPYEKAYQAARDRGDIYTTPRMSWERAKEAGGDLLQGKLWRPNTVDYSDAKRQVEEIDRRNAGAGAPPRRGPVTPEENEQRKADYIRERLGGGQQQPAANQPAVEPHVQRMQAIDADMQKLYTPVRPAGDGISSPKGRTTPELVKRYQQDMAQDKIRHSEETNARHEAITRQYNQDHATISAYNAAAREAAGQGTEVPAELRQAYHEAQYRLTNGQVKIPAPPKPPEKPPEKPGFWSGLFGGGGGQQQPIRVKSMDEARKLPKGQQFFDPNGVLRTVP